MRTLAQILGWFYTHSLKLYPSEFREEFKAEMVTVFAQAIVDNQKSSSLLRLLWRELRDLPLSLAREHWHALKEIPMITIYKKPEWYFFPGWVLLSTLSFFLAGVITWIIVGQVVNVIGGRVMINGRSHITEDWLAGYVFVPLLGVATGLLQYLLLRRYLPRMGWWIAVTILGVLLVPVIGYMSTFLPGRFLNGNSNGSVFMMIALMAGLLSFMQWLILRRRVPHAIWWIPATIAGWLAVRLVTGEGTIGPLDIVPFTVLPAIVTGITLGLLINQVDQHEPKGA